MDQPKKFVYLDNASTTLLDKEVWAVMQPYYKHYYGNPSSNYTLGAQSKVALEQARRTISQLLAASNGHIFFTSGGTESNNWAIVGAVTAYGIKDIITSPIAHKSILSPIMALVKQQKVNVHYVKIDAAGAIDYKDIERLLSTYPQSLVSLLHGNNEIGTLHDLTRIGRLCRKYGAIFHTDMVQTLAYQAIKLDNLPVDLATGSAHKFHGPKGVGLLYVDHRLKLTPLIWGGAQEQSGRAGTENLPAIVGMAEALKRAVENRTKRIAHIQHVKSVLYQGLVKAIDGMVTYGHPLDPKKGLCHILSVGLPEQYNPETIFLRLDIEGIAVSAGSACMSGTNQRSHVLEALGIPSDKAVIRFSLSHHTTAEDIAYGIKKMATL